MTLTAVPNGAYFHKFHNKVIAYLKDHMYLLDGLTEDSVEEDFRPLAIHLTVAGFYSTKERMARTTERVYRLMKLRMKEIK